MSKYIQIYDGEFSHSNSDSGDILSLACIIIHAETLSYVDSFTGYACPRDLGVWNPYAEKIHGITKERAKSFPPQRELAIKLLHFLKPYKNENNSPLPMIIHASSYVDYTFIVKMYEKVGLGSSIEKVIKKSSVIRTDLLFKELLKREGLTKKANLKVMADHFGVKLNHHECLSDTKACCVGFREMVKYFKNKTPLNRFPEHQLFNKIVTASVA